MVIFGDSMINGIDDKRLSRNGLIKTRKFPGCTTSDLKHHSIPTIEKKPSLIIFHTGTKDITNGIDTINNYKQIVSTIKKKSASTKIVISSVITRKDKKNLDKQVSDLNCKLKQFFSDNLIDFMENNNIDESCLGTQKLHLYKKGNAYPTTKVINFKIYNEGELILTLNCFLWK